jgi:hypothetical protein
MDFLTTFNNLTLLNLSNPTQQAIKRQHILRDQFHECNDASELAIIYELYLATGGDLRYLEMSSRPQELIKQMSAIYRANN